MTAERSSSRGDRVVSTPPNERGTLSRGPSKPYSTFKDSPIEWLGKIPAHWDYLKIKYSTYVKGRIGWQNLRSDEFTDEGPYCVTGTEFVNGGIDWTRCYHVSMGRYEQDRFIQLRKGDLLVTKDGSIGKVALVDDLPGPACLNSGVFVTRPLNGRYSSDYLYWVLSSGVFTAFIDYMSAGSTIQHLYQYVFGTFVFPAPSMPEQRAVAAFLDRETASIDALVAKKERLIELLQERRTALITRAVTKGLNPNVRMKASGVEWLGEIPAHWEVKPLTKYVVDKSDYRGKTPEKVSSGVFLVTARNVRMGLIDYECSEEYVAADEYEKIMRRGFPKKGDILFTTEAPLGNVARVDREDIALAQRIIRFRMDAKHFESRFTLFAMMSDYFQAQLTRLSTGSTAEGLKASKLPMLRLIAPPLIEQYVIVDFLEQQTTKLDVLIAKVRDAIGHLRELRTAVISAAVTGKIDVRGEAA